MAGTAITITDYRTQIPGELTPDRMMFVFPVIESVSNGTTRGKERKTFWRVIVSVGRGEETVPIEDRFFTYIGATLPGDLCAIIRVESGFVGGKIRATVPTIVCKGKNIGRANQTNPFTQALRDALGLYNKQLKKSLHSPQATGVTRYPPMLAKVLARESMDELPYPVYVQRKYNGVRGVAVIDDTTTGVILYSRKGHLYPGFEYLRRELDAPLRGIGAELDGDLIYLDGELYKHGVPLQEISAQARKETGGAEETNTATVIDFMIYDCFMPRRPTLIYSERLAILARMFARYKFAHCKLVETFTAKDKNEVTRCYEQFLTEGFEGAMIRLDSPYKYSYHDYHSSVLLKMKPVMDGEFEVVGWTVGKKGKAAGAFMVICKTKTGIEFPVTPAMELPERMALSARMDEIQQPSGKTYFEENLKGKPLIVYFDEFSKDGVPQRARTKMEIRTWE